MNDIEANKQVVRELFDAIASGDAAMLEGRLDKNLEWWVSGEAPIGGVKDFQSFKDVVKEVLWDGMAGPATVHIEQLTAEEDRVSLLGNGDMTLKDGRPYRNRYHILMWVRDGKVYRAREFFDTAYLSKLLAVAA